MNIITLSPRLECIAGLVPQGAKVADVGTDHGYIPVWLLQNSIVSSAIASDIRPGPLERAVISAQNAGLEDKIKFILCDGLNGCPSTEIDTVIIAGMGGETISEILHQAPWTRDNNCLLILQPMSKVEVLRYWLISNGYTIKAERLVKDAGTIYPVIVATSGCGSDLSDAELYVGSWDLTNGEPLLNEYLESYISKMTRAIYGIEQSTKSDDQTRLDKLKLILCELSDMRSKLL